MTDPYRRRTFRPAVGVRGPRRPVSLHTLAIAVIWAMAAVVVAVFLFRIRQALVPFGLAIMISYVISPFAAVAERRGAPRTAAILIAYLMVVAIFAFVLAFVVPPLASGLNDIVDNYAEYGSVVRFDGLADDWATKLTFLPEGAGRRVVTMGVNRAERYISELADAAGRALSAAAGQLVSFLLAPVIAFYFTRDAHRIRESFASWLPAQHRMKIMTVVDDIDGALAGWIRGQALVCAFVAVATASALALLQVPYALPVAFIAGLLEIIPYFGPVLGMVPAVLMAARRSTTTALLAAVAFTLIQQVEAGVLSPKIVGDNVGLHPLAVIAALLISGSLLGVLGILLAVPVAAVLSIVLRSLLTAE